ncbi:Heterogeneous nuclear ribonucleoprotein 1 [Platanthera guangdongensis]|uniref:Heterogeneous nuclear ribonucleoprotein 1 n=1 Tax=Platanthera guangdongensis TaxID=2320717 RepID=A0ABR2LPX6_9ASPA
MESDQGKLFIGGISWETTEEKLKGYFGQYGDVSQAAVMRDKATGKPRGFGFVVFSDPSILERVLQDAHTIDGRTVEAKKAMSREEQQTTDKFGNSTKYSGGGCGGGNFRTKKIFVGGLPPTLSDMEFRKYFEAFGAVTDVVVMYDLNTQRPRGFGFISFDSEDSVDSVVQKQFHDVGGKEVEVKRALPKDANPSITANRSTSGGSSLSYGGPSANSNSFDNRVDSSRHMRTAANGAVYNTYGSSGYSAAAYGYGTATNGVGYGTATNGIGYETATNCIGYGTATNGVGYGGFGGYGNTGAYGNPGGPVAGYAPPGTPRSSWTNQPSSGYVSAGYGANAGYGAAGLWNTHGSSVPVYGHTGQSAGTAAGYGNQGYGGSAGPYGNQGGYGAFGGHGGVTLAGNPTASAGEQSACSGHNDGSETIGYSNAWRSDSARGGGYGAVQLTGASGGLTGYGGGYGGSQSRQG